MKRSTVFIQFLFLAIGFLQPLLGIENALVNKGSGYTHGTSIWTIVVDLHDILQEVNVLIASLSNSVNSIESNEQNLSELVNYVATESARRIDLVFTKAEEVRQQTTGELQALAQYLQYVALESSRQLQEVLGRTNEIGLSAASHLDILHDESQSLGFLVDQVALQAESIEAAVLVVQKNQLNLEETLDTVKKNGVLAAQGISMMTKNNSVLNSKIDALSHNLVTCCTELNENDAKIFSAVERIETTLASAPVRKPRKKPSTIKSIDDISATNTVKFIRNNNEIDTTGLVMQLPGVYILTETIYFKEGGFIISGNNITLDLNGFSIISLSEDIVPLTVEKSDSLTIINGTLIGGQGIFVSNSNGIMFNNIAVNNSTHKAMSISAVTNVTLNNVSIANGIDGIIIDSESANILCKNSVVCDCQKSGLDLQANRIWIEDMIVQNNGSHGITASKSSDLHIFRTSVDANSGHGIFIDSSVLRCQVEGCRVSGNNGVGFYNNGAEVATWTNNFAQGNKEANYINIDAVSLREATSFWYNVSGN